MDELLSKIYDKVAFYEQDSVQLGKEYDNIVEEMLEPLKGRKTETEIEEIKELIYQAAYYAQKNGFQIGIRFGAKFLMESLVTDKVEKCE